VTRFLRYLAATDASLIGQIALAFLKEFLKISRVRVGSLSGALSGGWEPFAPLLGLELGDYTNVVCCDPTRWTWEQRVPMPKRLPSGELVLADEVATGRQELYTQGVRNVLITNERFFHHTLSQHQRDAALRYEEIVLVGAATSDGMWRSVRKAMPRVIGLPMTESDRQVLRRVLLP
jgi:hypothetical protein